MRLRIASRLGVVLALIALAVGVPEAAEAQPVFGRPQPKVIAYQPPTDSAAVVGILGEVRRPGSYRLPPAATLRQLIDACGGFTEAASPTIRVVRGYRVVQQVAIHAAAEDVPQTGDLIVVDRGAQVSREAPRSAPLRVAANHESHEFGAGLPTPPADDPGVQLAFLGVTDHPVIVKVRTEQARPDLIVQMLGQSPDVLRSARMIPPPQHHTTRSGQLASGTVLLFDPRQIVAGELKDLPSIIPCSQLEQPDIGAYGIRNAFEERQDQGLGIRNQGSEVSRDCAAERGPAVRNSSAAAPQRRRVGDAEFVDFRGICSTADDAAALRRFRSDPSTSGSRGEPRRAAER